MTQKRGKWIAFCQLLTQTDVKNLSHEYKIGAQKLLYNFLTHCPQVTRRMVLRRRVSPSGISSFKEQETPKIYFSRRITR